MIHSLARLLPPEAAHNLTVAALENIRPKWSGETDPMVSQTLWGIDFANPIGLAAGFDKDARAMGGCHGLGFGFVEVGSITPQPQPGNDKPRVFRLTEDRAVINRYGFNSQGIEAAIPRLENWRRNPTGVLGVNLGKNKLTEQAADDYVIGAQKLGAFADYLVINVSSPNTPGLRAEQAAARLEPLLKAVRAETDKPLLVKVAPDVSDGDVESMVTAVMNSALDGIIVSNTTIARPDSLMSAHASETGGLSGAPLMAPSTQVLAQFAQQVNGAIPIIGVGGVASAEDAYAKLRAGASLVQLYSAMIYEGPGLIRRIVTQLPALLKRDGFETVTDAIGADL